MPAKGMTLTVIGCCGAASVVFILKGYPSSWASLAICTFMFILISLGKD